MEADRNNMHNILNPFYGKSFTPFRENKTKSLACTTALEEVHELFIFALIIERQLFCFDNNESKTNYDVCFA